MKKIFIFFLNLITFAGLWGGCAPTRDPWTTPSSTRHSERHGDPLRILLDPPPVTLNPRSSTDVTSQRIQELLFSALTRIDANMIPRADLAERWEVSPSGKSWRFPIHKNLKDHAGRPIRPEDIRECLENYRIGKPVSLFRGAFPGWEATTADRDSVTIHLKKPDPYLARNLSLLRYFRYAGDGTPCSEPRMDRPLIGSGPYRAQEWDYTPETRFVLTPISPDKKTLELVFLHDDDTKSLKLFSGEIDGIQQAISLTKLRWIRNEYQDRFDVYERPGVAVSYLAFNMRDPILARKRVRQAITRAIDRGSVVRNKHWGRTTVAASILSPLLPESHPRQFPFDRARAESLLEQEGFPRGKDGIRLKLHYKTTPVIEGIETALMFQDMLRKIGIELIIDVVEPAVFFSLVKKGSFQLYSSRWIGVADGSILYNSLHSGQHLNRIGYQDPEMDRLLEAAVAEADSSRRIQLMRQVQDKLAEDLPYFPLWHWNVALILSKGFQGISDERLSASGSLEPLTHLR